MSETDTTTEALDALHGDLLELRERHRAIPGLRVTVDRAEEMLDVLATERDGLSKALHERILHWRDAIAERDAARAEAMRLRLLVVRGQSCVPGFYCTWHRDARAALAILAHAEDERPCTCHPSEAPKPCPRQFSLSACLARAALAQKDAGQ